MIADLSTAVLAFAALLVLPPPGGAPTASTADTVREYVARQATPPPVVDGRLDDAAWAAAAWTEPFVDIRGGDEPAPRLRTRAKLLWDDEYLYVGAALQEPDVWATLRQPDDTVWHDPDFEIFLDPDGDGLAYYEMEINALGTVLDLFMPRPYNRGGHADLAWDFRGMRSAVAVDGTLNDPSDRDVGWSVEVAIPWRAVASSPPGPGDVWRVNFSRVEWPLEVVDGAYRKAPRPPGDRHPEDNWVWSPQGVVNMHVPSMWGRVRFQGGTP